MMVYVIKKFRDFSFFQSEVNVDRPVLDLPPKNEVKKAYPKNRVKQAIKVTHISEETKYCELLHIKLFVSSGESSKFSFYPISCRQSFSTPFPLETYKKRFSDVFKRVKKKSDMKLVNWYFHWSSISNSRFTKRSKIYK